MQQHELLSVGSRDTSPDGRIPSESVQLIGPSRQPLTPPASRRSIPGIGRCAMKRLAVALLSLALVAGPLSTEGQQTRVHNVGVILQGGPYSTVIEGLRAGLRELGFEEG